MVLKKGKTKRPTLDDFIEHIDYLAQLLGSTDKIGIGTDKSLGTYPDHWHDPWGEPTYKDVTSVYDKYFTSNVRSPLCMVDVFSLYPEVFNIIDKLQKRRYSDTDVRKIRGENYMRVFKQVWK